MKHSSLISLAAVVAATSFILGLVAVQYSEIFYSIGPCIFLLLIAAEDFAPKARYSRSRQVAPRVDSTAQTTHPFQLAA
jgi:hypothetical protein